MRIARIGWLAVVAIGGCSSSSKSPAKPDAPTQMPDAAPITSCDGVQAADASGNKVDIVTFTFKTALTGCDPAAMTSLSNLIGVVDQFSEQGGTIVETITPQNCNDVSGVDNQGGASGSTWDATCPSSTTGCPASFTTVNSLKASWPTTATSETVVGVVESVNAATEGGGNFYIEDGGSCTTNCGLEVYVPKTVTTPLPAVGALVTATGMTGAYDGAKQITAASLSVIGTTSYKLLPVVSLSAQMVGPMAMTMAAPYEGMRVKVTGTLTTSTTCPSELTYTSNGG